MSWTFISIFISIILLIAIIRIIIVPTPVKYVLSQFYPSIIEKENSNAKVDDKYTLYTNLGSSHKNLIVVFFGGGGISCKLNSIYGFTNKLNDLLGNEFDIVTFDYPVRFQHRIWDAMNSINTSLIGFNKSYTNIHAIGISFGALLAGAFYQKEESLDVSEKMNIERIGIHFKSFIGLSGLYETTPNDSFLTKLFNFYIMRNTPAVKKYTCFGMELPRLIMSATSDFLINQTYKYIDTEDVQFKIYESETLPHAFFQIVDLPESKKAIERMIVFIKANTTSDQSSDQKDKSEMFQFSDLRS